MNAEMSSIRLVYEVPWGAWGLSESFGDYALIEDPWKIGGLNPRFSDESDKSLDSNYHR